MKKLLILCTCVSLVVFFSSCRMNTETNDNSYSVSEQVLNEEHKSENTMERDTKADDVMSADSSNRISTEIQNIESVTDNSYYSADNTDTSNSNSVVTESYEQRRKKEFDVMIENAISDQSYNSVLKNTVSDDIIINYLDETMKPWLSNIETFLSMNNRYKIELVRVTDEKRMYSIQKPESGGLFYSFYVDNVLRCTAYITKSLSLADYNTIKIGSSIDDVIAIEPAAQAYINRSKTFDNLKDNGELSGGFYQHIILKDGLLKFTYSRIEDTYEYKVNQIDFYEDFKETIDWGIGDPLIYDYSIFPEDYPS